MNSEQRRAVRLILDNRFKTVIETTELERRRAGDAAVTKAEQDLLKSSSALAGEFSRVMTSANDVVRRAAKAGVQFVYKRQNWTEDVELLESKIGCSFTSAHKDKIRAEATKAHDAKLEKLNDLKESYTLGMYDDAGSLQDFVARISAQIAEIK